MADFKETAVRGASWSTLEGLASQGCSFLIFLVLARLLAPADFGAMALANVYLLTGQLLIYQGLGQAILQFADLDDEHLDTVFWLNGVAGLALFFLTFLVADALAAWFHAPGLAPLLRGLSPIFILTALSDVPANLLARQMEFRTLALRTLASYLAGGVVVIGMASHGWGAWSLVGQQLTVGAVNLAALWSASAWRPRLRFSMPKARRLLSFSRHLLTTDLVNLANRRLDQIFVGRAFGPMVTGYYALGSRVASLVNEVLTRSLARVTVTTLSRLQAEGERFRRAVYQVAEMQSAVMFPVAVGLALVAPEVMTLCFGGRWRAAVPVMQVLLLACPAEALLALHQFALVARGTPRWCFLLTSAHTLANLGLFTFAVRGGAVAVAGAYTLRAFALYPAELLFLRRVAGFSPWQFGRVLFPQAAACAVMAGGVLGIRRALAGAGPLPLLVASTAAGALCYGAALTLFNRELVGSLRRIGRPAAVPGGIGEVPG